MGKKTLVALGLTLAFSLAYSRHHNRVDPPIASFENGEVVSSKDSINLGADNSPTMTQIIAGEYFVDHFPYDPQEMSGELQRTYQTLQESFDTYAGIRDEMSDINYEKEELRIESEDNPTNNSFYSQRHSELSSRWWDLHHEGTKLLREGLYDAFSDYEEVRREVETASSLVVTRKRELSGVESLDDLSQRVKRIDTLSNEQEREIADYVQQYGLKIYLHEMGITY